MSKNTEIIKFCKEVGITEDQFYGRTTVGGDLDLNSLTSIPAGFNPTVGGYLNLSSLTSIPAGFNPTVGGYLNLSSLTSIPAGFNPTVGGSLYLRSLTSIPAGFNPTVGGDLDLNSLSSEQRSNVKFNKLPENHVMTWQEGKYMKLDGIFVELVNKLGKVYRVKKLNTDKVIYIVTDGNGKFSHGETMKEAKDSLIYKIGNRDKSRYEKLTTKSDLPLAEMIECYRVITGACEFGVKNFINSVLLGKPKKEYKIEEIIKLTKSQFGHDTFENFFK